MLVLPSGRLVAWPSGLRRVGWVEIEEEEDELGHDLAGGDVSGLLVGEEEGGQRNERVGRAGSDGGGSEKGS